MSSPPSGGEARVLAGEPGSATQTVGCFSDTRPGRAAIGSETAAMPAPPTTGTGSRPSFPAGTAQRVQPATTQNLPALQVLSPRRLPGRLCVFPVTRLVRPLCPLSRGPLPSTAGLGLGLRGRTAYLPVGEAQHGLHHGHALPVLQRVEGAVVLQGRKVLFPPGRCHLPHHVGLHLCKRRKETVTLSGARGDSVRARNSNISTS